MALCEPCVNSRALCGKQIKTNNTNAIVHIEIHMVGFVRTVLFFVKMFIGKIKVL